MTQHDPSEARPTFTIARRGYAREEVDGHLEVMDIRVRELEERLQAAEKSKNLSSVASERLATIISAAEQTAEETRAEAEAESKRLLDEAREEARATKDRAEREARARTEETQRRAREAMAEAASRAREQEEEAQERARQELAEAERRARELQSEAESRVEELLTEATRRSEEYVERADQASRELGERKATALASADTLDSELDSLIEHMKEEADGLIQRLRAKAEELELGEPVLEPGPTRADLDGRTPDPTEVAGARPEQSAHNQGGSKPLRDEAGIPGDDGTPATESAVAVGDMADAARDGADGARLVALNMAMNGTPRDETAAYLRNAFGVEDEELLDDVYSQAERGDVAPGRAPDR